MERKDFIKSLTLLPLVPAAMKLEHLKNITDNFDATEKMPVLFIGHGSPMNAIEDNPFTKTLKAMGEDINKKQKPKAILVVSAHWLTRGSYVNINPKPEVMYDFGGFPDELFKVQYPAVGSPEFAQQVTDLVARVQKAEDWGIDHGAWTILKHMFPAADIPVFQLSIDYYVPMDVHFNIGRMLRKLREKGVLIIGSGNIVHNLGLSMKSMMEGNPKPYDWAIEFDEWVKKKVTERDFQALVTYEKSGKPFKLAVPTIDHYAPMLYTLALAEENDSIVQSYEEVTYGGISMRCFKIG